MPLVLPELRAARAVLLLPSDPRVHASAIATAAAVTSSQLLVVLLSVPNQSWGALQSTLSFAYTAATSVAVASDKLLMDVDVVIGEERGASVGKSWDRVFRAGDAPVPAWLDGVPLVDLPPNGEVVASSGFNNAEPAQSFPVVALGGTFDHLHAGHKILLSMAASIATRKIIVGVTDDALLVRKKNKHLLESIDQRTARVRGFLQLFKPGLELDIVPISDVYGPTAWDADIQGLVVSRETLPGAGSIAELRAQKQLPELQVFVIDVVSSDASRILGLDIDAGSLVASKMSSTAIRQWIADHNQHSNLV